MPIRSRDDAAEVEDRIARFFSAQPDERPRILRRLFAEVLDVPDVDGAVSLSNAPDSVELPDAASRIAQIEGVHVLYVALSDTTSDRVNKREAAAAVKLISEELGDDLLVLFTNESASQLHWIHPQFGSATTPTLRRMVVERDLPRRTAVQQVSNIYWNHQDLGNIRDALHLAFDVERVTKDFFEKYHEVYEEALELVTGVHGEERKLFVQTLFNRLMFVYFLSRKGWLTYDGDTDYLSSIWKAYRADAKQTNFYDDRLHRLFFLGLNNPDQRDVSAGVDYVIGDVPFLNGGLFEETELDKRSGVTIPDDAIEPVLKELFDKFNFTVMESTPLDIEVAVDPEMLGKVFEELVTDRGETGSFYTPREIVAFMCREALKGLLHRAAPALTGERVAQFVEKRDVTGLGRSTAVTMLDALATATVIDPACGSGAFLLGMMHELVELQQALLQSDVIDTSKELYELKREIIEENLYGVDSAHFAVNIARLRLWLSLAIEFHGPKPLPLPNLEFKILAGDSLAAGDPSQGHLLLDRKTVARLAQKKSRYLKESRTDQKKQLKQDILAGKQQLADQNAANLPAGAFDWRVEFAEVFADGGFDIVIGNPPYAQVPKSRYPATIFPFSAGKDPGKQNLYKLFVERSYQLTKQEGTATLIVQSSLMCDYTSSGTRQLLLDHTQLVHVIEFPKDAATPSLKVFNSVTQGTCIYQFKKGATAGERVLISVGNDAASIERPLLAAVAIRSIRQLYPGLNYLPLVDSAEASLVAKIAGNPSIRRLGSLTSSVRQGDLNLSTHASRYSTRKSEVLLLRGRDIGKYVVRRGQVREFCTKDAFPERVAGNREGAWLLGQGITGTTDARRLHFALADTLGYDYLCGHSINKVQLTDASANKLVLGMLNSSLLDWYFRITSTNNNVQNYEIEALPIVRRDSNDERAIESLVDQILAVKDGDPEADTSKLEAKIDRHVYDLYDLTEDEIEAVEARVGD